MLPGDDNNTEFLTIYRTSYLARVPPTFLLLYMLVDCSHTGRYIA